jgi:hypothetical protein
LRQHAGTPFFNPFSKPVHYIGHESLGRCCAPDYERHDTALAGVVFTRHMNISLVVIERA